MNTLNTIKVLVVEDDANWREALCQMYNEIMPQCNVKSASSGPDALRMIENNEKFDLLSLDINLGITHPKTEVGQPDLKVLGADGRSVLRKFHEKNACNGVVVITGLCYDGTITVVIPNKDDLRRVRSSLQVFLNTLFPSKHLYINKDIQMTVEDNVKIFKQDLTFEKIISICKPLPGVPPPYSIELTRKGNILIKSQNRRDSFISSITHPQDKEFIKLMCEMKKYREQNWISKKAVCAIYRGRQAKNFTDTRIAQISETDTNSFRRRLKKQGIDPNALFEVVRGDGWKLCDNVHLIGFASVDKRSSGLGKKYERDMDIDDLPNNNSVNSFDYPDKDSD